MQIVGKKPNISFEFIKEYAIICAKRERYFTIDK